MFIFILHVSVSVPNTGCVCLSSFRCLSLSFSVDVHVYLHLPQCPPQCDGVPIPLPSLQGIAVLNIPSYAGGTNFWGGNKENDVSFVCELGYRIVVIPVFHCIILFFGMF